MIVKNAAAQRKVTVVFITLCMIGLLVLLRMVFVMGVSSYMNAEGKKENGNMQAVGIYYLLQAYTGDFMEPYIAYYNVGTAYARNNKPDAAEYYLNISLAKVDNDNNECYIRNNLALVQEQLGDIYMVADMASTAETYYTKAVTTISDSPAVCFPPPPNGGGSSGGNEKSDGQKQDPDGNPLTPQDNAEKDAENGETMKDTGERSKEKEGQAKEAQGETSNGKEQVEKEMDQTKSEADNQSDVDSQKNNQSPTPIDKPW